MITKISISMPKSLEEFARSRVCHGGYGSISEYLRELIRLDQRFEIAKREPELISSAELLPTIATNRFGPSKGAYR